MSESFEADQIIHHFSCSYTEMGSVNLYSLLDMFGHMLPYMYP